MLPLVADILLWIFLLFYGVLVTHSPMVSIDEWEEEK